MSESLKEAYEGCAFGCIFHMDRLSGDCRIPESDKCEMNKRRKEAENENDAVSNGPGAVVHPGDEGGQSPTVVEEPSEGRPRRKY